LDILQKSGLSDVQWRWTEQSPLEKPDGLLVLYTDSIPSEFSL
jgi:hypothetical protein